MTTAITQAEQLELALVNPAFIADPYATLAQLREMAPVHWSDGIGGWVLTRYDDILVTFKDVPPFSNEGRLGRAADYLPQASREKLRAFADHYRTKGLLHSDPPDHTRLRRLVLQAFSPRAIEAMRPRIQQIVDRLIDEVEAARELDVIDDLAFALPVTVLADMMGVPLSEGVLFRKWADRLLAFQGVNKPAEDLLLEAQQALMEARAYLADLVERRRHRPGEDLISRMLQAQGDEELAKSEIINTGVTLLTAGHETTTSLIGNGVLTLLQRPQQWDRMRADRSTVAPAIEEILRFESPVARQPRLLTHDVELGGRHLKSGEMVFQMLNAANRDPAVFVDPDHFDITRSPNRHIAFGKGIHFCIGAPLSRLEGHIVLNTMLDRMPQARLVDPTPSWDVRKANSRVLKTLPVTF